MTKQTTRSIDDKIAALSPDVDETLRNELQAVLRTLRKADNPKGAIIETSSIALRMIRQLIKSAGYDLPEKKTDNLFSCCALTIIGFGEVQSVLMEHTALREINA